jgi:hypothetical protein
MHGVTEPEQQRAGIVDRDVKASGGGGAVSDRVAFVPGYLPVPPVRRLVRNCGAPSCKSPCISLLSVVLFFPIVAAAVSATVSVSSSGGASKLAEVWWIAWFCGGGRRNREW